MVLDQFAKAKRAAVIRWIAGNLFDQIGTRLVRHSQKNHNVARERFICESEHEIANRTRRLRLQAIADRKHALGAAVANPITVAVWLRG